MFRSDDDHEKDPLPASTAPRRTSASGWRHLRLLSSAANSYNRDYRGEAGDGSQLPMLNVFVKRDGRIHHFYSTEMCFAPTERGQDGRHVDLIWPLWSLFDVLPEGRGTTWYPKLTDDRP